MTVAIGLLCRDGVLVASDSMGSADTIAAHTVKVHTLAHHPVIWTAAGSVYVSDEVEIELQKLDAGTPLQAFTTPDLPAVRSKIRSTVAAGIKHAFAGSISMTPLPPGNILTSYMSSFMILGYSNGTPWFFEMDHEGQINSHASQRFAAVGSGGPSASTALALMSHHVGADLVLEDAKLLAYRTIDTTIRVSSQFVGPPVQIAVCDKDGARLLDDDELAAVRTGVDRWTVLEADLLSSLKSGEQEAVGDIPALGSPPV